MLAGIGHIANFEDAGHLKSYARVGTEEGANRSHV
jgi:hypothetical protein